MCTKLVDDPAQTNTATLLMLIVMINIKSMDFKLSEALFLTYKLKPNYICTKNGSNINSIEQNL